MGLHPILTGILGLNRWETGWSNKDKVGDYADTASHEGTEGIQPCEALGA